MWLSYFSYLLEWEVRKKHLERVWIKAGTSCFASNHSNQWLLTNRPLLLWQSPGPAYITRLVEIFGTRSFGIKVLKQIRWDALLPDYFFRPLKICTPEFLSCTSLSTGWTSCPWTPTPRSRSVGSRASKAFSSFSCGEPSTHSFRLTSKDRSGLSTWEPCKSSTPETGWKSRTQVGTRFVVTVPQMRILGRLF